VSERALNPNEVDTLEWVSPGDALALIRGGEIDGLSLTSLLMTLVSAQGL